MSTVAAMFGLPKIAMREKASKASKASKAGKRPVSTKPAKLASPDVRLMNGVAATVALLAAGLLLVAGLWWFVRLPQWTIRSIEVTGDLQRNSPATLRANTMPRLNGTFFTLDLHHARQVFESVPWVRSAVVRRVWPNRLAVNLQEHRAVARWTGPDGSERLVNNFGEVFEANLGEIEGDALPVFEAPEGWARQVLQMHQKLTNLFAPMERRVTRLDVSGRGSWSLMLDDGAEIALGRGSPEEVLARTERFVATVTQVTGAYRVPVLSADLRHTGGYAVLLKGATAASAPASAPRGRK